MRIVASTPSRIGLLGGGTDVNPFAEKYGGKSLSLAISIHHNVSLVPRQDKQILVENLGEVRQLNLEKKLPEYGEDKNFDLIYAIINYFRKKFPSGFNLYDRFEGKHSAGLGSSGSAAVAVIGAINHWLKLGFSKKKIALLAWQMETKELKWISGKQDQIAAAYGGINIGSFGPGEENFKVHSLSFDEKFKKDLESWLVLCYTGGTRRSSLLQAQLRAGMAEKEKIKALLDLKEACEGAEKYLRAGQWSKLGRLLNKAWQSKKRSNPAVTTERIDYLYSLAKDQGALGGKIMGAGGEGHMFFICPPQKRRQVTNALANEKAEIIEFSIEDEGLRVETADFAKNYHSVLVRENFQPKKSWAVFIDRDGTVNQEVHLLHRLEDFQLIPGVIEAIKKLNQARIPVIIYHNASVVARGLCGEDQVQKIHQHLIQELEKKRAIVDAVLYCPHHPTAFNLDYISACHWRKPNSGMIRAAAEMFNLDLRRSFVVGDNARDILMGQSERSFTILVKTGHAGKDTLYQAKPDKILKNLQEAVDFILKKRKSK